MTIDQLRPAQGVFINNRWNAEFSGREIDVYEPATGKIFARISAGGQHEIELAVTAARRAQEGTWGRLTATERGRILSEIARRIEDEGEDLAVLEAQDTGKPIRQARADIVAAARYFEYYGGAADKVHGDTIPFMEGYFVATERLPHGITGHIIPWNYPAQMFGRTLAPALAMGNACILKPAEDACQTPLRLAQIAADAGLPPGALAVVPGAGAEAGAALAQHPGIDFISFTGSPEVGVFVQEAAARNYIGCTLELGGKSPQLIFDDADLDKAVPVIINAIVQNSGQTCSAGARVLVQASVQERLTEMLCARFSELRVGTPEMDLDLGPVINMRQKERIERMLSLAEKDSVPLLAEGKISASTDGYFVPPKLYGPVPQDHPLAREEVFGPVLSMQLFETEGDAIALANGTDYALVASVWSRDTGRAMRVARQISAGQVYINSYGAGGGIELPFGGMRKSGHGREKGFEALIEFSTLRTIVVKHD